MKRALTFLALCAVVLGGCTSSSETAYPPSVSGGKSATVALDVLAKRALSPRPSGSLGVFSTLFLAQQLFLPTQSATDGIEQILRMVRSQEQPLGDETFALLQTLGDTLSVNIVDMLNRSTDRIVALDQYVSALTNIIDNGKRRDEELTTALDTIGDQKKEQRALVRDLERTQKDAIKAKDFATAGAKEAELSKAQTTLSETELKESQAKSSQRQLTDLLSQAEKRLLAIEKNREILLAGLTISDPQGLKDLGLMRETSR
ncbi:hypothetical protein AUJ46_06005 [Candidatus Peregrinibacteria bacterium CG1_02_54_53]|nr:MAG: hypothetical protein AUJ46_06005 [Candidatus Peregrinibacteria bacterium CG1_02_54_53]